MEPPEADRGKPPRDAAGRADGPTIVAASPSRNFEQYAVLATFVLLTLGCYLVVRPFLTAFLWGAIIAVSNRALYQRFVRLVRGREKLAATLFGLFLVAILFVPISFFAVRLASGAPDLIARVDEMLSSGLRQPPAWLGSIPLVGKGALEWWQSVSADPERLRQELRPLAKPIREFLVAAGAGISTGILQFALAIFIAALLSLNGETLTAAVDRIAARLGGERGLRHVAIVRSTVRGVFRGLLGTCAVQAALAMIGFLIAGVPGVMPLGMATFFLSLVPLGPALLWLPAALWLNANGHGGMATFMAVWGLVVVGGAENIVRPLLMGKGIQAPLAVVFLGVIGGMFAFGFLGLFIGPTILTVAYNLFQEWMATLKAPDPDAVPHPQA
ncbi:MAG TPA: AI-2E family transporter [Thermoanaerobaculia bacterium]|nr:AI-2E family transporter [Thermoanaerobaculia bacterium]